MWTQKVCHSNVKKIKKLNHHQMRNVRIKCIEALSICEIFYFNFSEMP
jgi:hypothetical protein